MSPPEEPGVAAQLAEIRGRIDAARDRSHRRSDGDEVHLVGAAKRQSPERLQAAYDAGLRLFGENRVQEAVVHSETLADDVEWHLIGPLQSNKARRAASLFTTIQSIDRLKIARALDRHAGDSGRHLEGFLEINLGGEPTKHGFDPADLDGAAAELADLENLEITGLMAIPPIADQPQEARHWFAELRRLRDRLFSRPPWRDRPGYLSMGMSSDFELAIEEGATHVRVGTALFGPRPV